MSAALDDSEVTQKMVDFFVSYNKADRAWAEWIAWHLEEGNYTTILQEWDFRPGCNFVLEMQKASADTDRTIAVLSPDYIGARYTQPEWAAAFAIDPQGWERKLVPVRVRACVLQGLLAQIAYIDLVGVEEPDAKQKLLLGVRPGRAKPPAPPAYPAAVQRLPPAKPHFPGPTAQSSRQEGAAAHTGSLLDDTSLPETSSIALFQRIYLFAVESMHKSWYDAEQFALSKIKGTASK